MATIKWEPGSQSVVLSDGRTTVQSAFSALYHPFSDRPGLSVELDIEVDRWGRPRCVGLRMDPEEGETLNWKPLRDLRVDRLVVKMTQEAGSVFAYAGPTADGGSSFSFLAAADE